MTQLDWNATGERFYETGIDHGVLYIGETGYAWPGLTSVSESSSGGEAKGYYQDGVKYLNLASTEEYEATVEAYTYPEEFGQCDGTYSVGNGLFARQQRRKSFGFSYRTKIGNDLDGVDHGYKIHLVYDALVEPSNSQYQTLSDSIELLNFSWHVTTKPSLLDRFKPTAHFVIDSRETPEALLGLIEGILYGTEQASSRLPSAGELAFLFTSFESDIFDAGTVLELSYYTYDGGTPDSVDTQILDGGTP